MKRALVVTIPEKGHYFPLLGPAAALAARGVDVAFAAGADIRDDLARLGFSRVFVPPGAAPPTEELRGEKLTAILSNADSLRGWIRRLLVDAPAANVDFARSVVREFRPDVVCIDTMAYEGAIAASLEDVPWVGWATSLNPVVPDHLDSELIRTTRALDPDRRALFARYGLASRFRVSDVLSPRGTAAFTTEALAGEAPPGVALVGPSISRRAHGAKDETIDLDFTEGRPLVYVSFGSQAWHQPRRYDALIAAAEQAGVALLVAMGDLAADYRARALPRYIECVSFAPQLRALAAARAVVTHGGANSVMESLYFGVPSLIAPLCNDQPHNLHFVAGAGAGRGIDLERASVGDIARELSHLAGDCAERAAAARLSDSYRARSGAEGAAALAWQAAV